LKGVLKVTARKTGEVRFVKRENGYGFLRDIDSKYDYFFAANEIPGWFELIEIGDVVTFDVGKDNSGRYKAIEIQLKGEITDENQ
jgi:cold shock CspA family protein